MSQHAEHDPLRVLHLEDNPADRRMVQSLLDQEGIRCEVKPVESRADFLVALEREKFDVILSDYELPAFDGLSALALARDRCPDTPFIFVSGIMGEEQAIESLKAGATDYVLKHRLQRLAPAMRRALRELEDRMRRRQAEKNLRETEDLFRQITDNVADLVAILDLQGRRLYNSPSYRKLFGNVGGMPGTDSFIEIHPADRERVKRIFDETISTGVGQRCEFRFVLRDGSIRHIESQGSVIRDAAGKISNVLVVSRDITGRRTAEEQLREQAALLDKAQDAIAVCDLDYHISYWNKGAERVYGWNAEEVTGRDINELLHPHDSPALHQARHQVMEKGEWMGEFRHCTKPGQDITVQSRWTLVRDHDAKPKSVLIISTDITEKKISEAQFLRAQRMESLGTLAGGIAHDLNNMLAPILMASQLLRMKVSDVDSVKYLDTLEASTQRGASLVKQVLSFARGAEGERTELQLRSLIKEVQKILIETFARSIQIQAYMPQDLWQVLGDATQLHQVLMNLCVNARDAMPTGGLLEIAAENILIEPSAVRQHPVERPGAYVVLTVSDTGTGIPQHILDRIFDPFFTTKEPGKGSGIGLTTVQTILKSHGGNITVQSEVGKGTRFKCYLPALTAVAPAVGEIAPQPKAKLPWGHGECVLVVDDEVAIREIIQATLEKYGYRVLTANDGTEGLSLYMRHRGELSVIVTDMMMPVMDGAALIRALLKVDPAVKFLAMSGLLENDKVAELARPGQIVFMQKPFTTEKLLHTIHELLVARVEEKAA